MSHTPGPWKYCGQGEVCDQNDIPIAECYLRTDNIDADNRNGALIAAAPDLLEALRHALSWLITDRNTFAECARNPITKAMDGDDQIILAGYDDVIDTAEAAIAKAGAK